MPLARPSLIPPSIDCHYKAAHESDPQRLKLFYSVYQAGIVSVSGNTAPCFHSNSTIIAVMAQATDIITYIGVPLAVLGQ
jgi:hypothetical protein